MSSGEFDIIEEYFSRLIGDGEQALALKDDAAVLSIPSGQELVVSTDTLHAGTHFLDSAHAGDIAHKAIRQNLSDLAAMGAEPHAYQLSIALPEKPEHEWLEAFIGALIEVQQEFGFFCSGGDTTSINGPLSLSMTIMGTAPEGISVRRSGARPGDALLVTGPVGDAYLGLQILLGKLESEHESHFMDAYYRPDPRLDLIENIRTYAHAAIDISDGLIGDLSHIGTASGVGAQLNFDDIQFSEAAVSMLNQGLVTPEQLLTGGDDYQLLLAVPQDAVEYFAGAQIIGEFHEGEGVTIKNKADEILDLKHTGWSHF